MMKLFKADGVWPSLVGRLIWDQEVASSNLVTPSEQQFGRTAQNGCLHPYMRGSFELLRASAQFQNALHSETCCSLVKYFEVGVMTNACIRKYPELLIYCARAHSFRMLRILKLVLHSL